MPPVIISQHSDSGGVRPPSLEELQKANQALLTSSFDQARTYSQVVLGIGYVSLFAAWSFTKELLTPDQILWSALLGCLSVFVFVMFEVFSMFMISRTLIGLSRAVQSGDQFHEVMMKNQKADAKLMAAYLRSWTWCWGFSVLTGVLAAFVLVGAFVGHLMASYLN